MSNFEEFPEEDVQFYSMPPRDVLLRETNQFLSENEFKMYGRSELEEIIDDFEEQEVDAREIAAKLMNMINVSPASRELKRQLSKMRRSTTDSFSDSDYIFAIKHRYRIAATEARVILDFLVADPAAASWGHEVIDDDEWIEIFGAQLD